MQNFFYATDDDEKAVWRMALAIPGLQIFESSTQQRRDLRQFNSPEEISEAQGNSSPYLDLCLFPSTAGGSPEIERVYTDEGELWRQTLRGPMIIGYTRYPPVSGCMNYRSFYAWNETGARGRSIYDEERLDCVNWKKHSSVFRKLRREMEKTAPAKLGSVLILQDAFSKFKSGEIKLWGAGEISISSPGIIIKSAKLH